MRRENKELRELLGKVDTTSDRHSNLLIPDIQRETQSLKAQVGVIASQTPTDTPWELVSERVTAEIDQVLST